MTFLVPLSEEVRCQFNEGMRMKDGSYRGRFAPSPSGAMHLGNVRTALFSWLRARLNDGTWLLRVDDLDQSRNKTDSFESIQSNLLWLGLNWDGPIIKQNDRVGLYGNVIAALKDCGMLYACRCSRRKLRETQKLLGMENYCPESCRQNNHDFGCFDGRFPSWKLKVAGKSSINFRDVVVRRADGFISYHLATVVDELTMGISEVVRGEDLMDAIFPQLAIAKTLNYKLAKYAYVPIWLDKDGRKLSKRNGGIGLNSLRSRGMTSSQVIGYLASTLDIVPIGTEISCNELLSHVNKNRDEFNRLFKC